MSEPDEAAEVFSLLEEDIIFGRMPPGARLVEDALMGRYNRTRHAVREALAKLEHTGIVTRERNFGARVRAYDREQVLEIYQVRELLQRHAALMIRLPVADALVGQLESLNAAFAAEGARQNWRGVHESNDAFHLALFGACGNTYLVGSISHYMGLTLPMRATTLADPEAFAMSLRQHAAMIGLLGDTDNWALAQLCVEHIQPSKQDYLMRTPGPVVGAQVKYPRRRRAAMKPSGAAGTMESSGVAGMMEPPGVAGMMEPPGVAGTMQPPGAAGMMEQPGAAGHRWR